MAKEVKKINGVPMCLERFSHFVEAFNSDKYTDEQRASATKGIKVFFNKAASGDVPAIMAVVKQVHKATVDSISKVNAESNIGAYVLPQKDIESRNDILKLAEYVVEKENDDEAKMYAARILMDAAYIGMPIYDNGVQREYEQCCLDAYKLADELLVKVDEGTLPLDLEDTIAEEAKYVMEMLKGVVESVIGYKPNQKDNNPFKIS